MKKLLYILAPLILGLSACTEDKCEREITYETQIPVYQSWEELRTPIQAENPRVLENMGKIYFKDSFVFISEPNEGIHVIDMSSVANPEKIAFIPIPGNKDMAVKGDMLYADSYTDLVVIDISSPEDAFEAGRMESLYPHYSYFMGIITDPEQGVVIDYKTETITQTYDCDEHYGIYYDGYADGGVDFIDSATDGGFEGGDAVSVGGGTTGNTGVGGSFARFTIKNNRLYAVSDRDLLTVDIENVSTPNLLTTTPVGWNIETLFPYEQSLFMGSQAGMFIYSINNPNTPDYIAEFQHARACDPVVVDEDIAYVTLRDGTECEGFANQVDVIDVNDLFNPELIQSKELFHPMGIGVDNGVLFVCDDEEGLKIFDCSNPYEELTLVAHHPEFQAYDVIPKNGLLIMIGADGLFLYNYKNANDITLVGSILKGN